MAGFRDRLDFSKSQCFPPGYTPRTAGPDPGDPEELFPYDHEQLEFGCSRAVIDFDRLDQQ